MPLLQKTLVAFVLVLPGGIVLAPALALWLRRHHHAAHPAAIPGE